MSATAASTFPLIHTGNEENDKDVNEWIRFGMRLGVSAALHPFEYSKVLIQLGYEPIPARPGKSFFGRNIMVLPNIFQYAGYIRRVDGLSGCYRGLTPKLIGSLLSMFISEKVAERLELAPLEDNSKDEVDISEEEMYFHFKYNLKRDLILSVSGIVIAHPFHVISVRMMAQFIGRENLYNSLFSSIGEVYRTEGILGFFSGLIPKILCDVACLVLTSSTVFIINKYVTKDKVGRQYNSGFIQFAFSSLLYPLQVVSTCMTVTGSRLVASKPPIMPEYTGWINCWNDLQSRGDLKRGSSLFWRSASLFKTSRRSDITMPILAKYE